MIEMHTEGNMVSDDDEEDKESSVNDEGNQGKEQSTNKRTMSTRKVLSEGKDSKNNKRRVSKKIIEMNYDDNDDVSSDEFLDHPGSLPRNSFGHDTSDLEPIMRDSSLTLESFANSNRTSNRLSSGKGKKGVRKGANLNKKNEQTCASSCCEDAKCILF